MDLELFFKTKFERLLDDADVDEVVILLGERTYEVWDGDMFLEVLAKKILKKDVRSVLLSGIEFLRKVKLSGEER